MIYDNKNLIDVKCEATRRRLIIANFAKLLAGRNHNVGIWIELDGNGFKASLWDADFESPRLPVEISAYFNSWDSLLRIIPAFSCAYLCGFRIEPGSPAV